MNHSLHKSRITSLLKENKEAYLTKNRYRVIRHALLQDYPFLKELSKETVCQMLKDVCYLDREVRFQTEGHDEIIKTQLSQEKVLSLGYGGNIKLKI